MRSQLLPLVLIFLVTGSVGAQDGPQVLDCTGPAGADAKAVLTAQRAWAKHLGEASYEKSFSLDKAGKVTIEMVLLPPGKYHRGEGKNAAPVTLTQPLWVAKYEATQHQYEALMSTNPSHFKRTGKEAAFVPVECVSHIEAAKFCAAASDDTGFEFRLLTEAEWEYAYRAGTRTKFHGGDTDESLGAIAQFGGNNQKGTERIGSKDANAFGLYDTAGNVWEWVSDPWTGSYDTRTATDPIGPPTGQGRVTRGGCWASSADNCRAAHRSRDAETYGGSHLGFRIACVPSSPKLVRTPPPPLDCTGPDGADARTVVASQRAWARYLGERSFERSFPLDKTGAVPVEMVLVPPGKYHRGDEKNPIVVTLTRPLWVGKYEVTQKQYEALTGTRPSHFKKDGAASAHYPVEKVSHLDVRKFCQTASDNTGAVFRLLWEAEWEYAYRAGTRTKYYNGDADDNVFDIAQCTENNFKNPEKVGSKAPNTFGLYDMAGNVAEWCGDAWKRDFVEAQTTDPRGPDAGPIRVNRGNAWDSYGRTCRATARSAGTETYAGSQLGFRLARVATAKSSANKLEIIDTHVHFFDPKRPTAPPKPKDDKPLPRAVLPADLKTLAQPLGVTGVLIVEASPLLEDNQWWLDLAAKEPFIIGVVGRIDPASDDFEKNLRRFAKNPLYRGIRMSHNELKAGLKGNLVERCKLLVELDLVLDLLGGPDMPADVDLLADKLPKLRIVINHAANLRIDGKEPPAKWLEGMAAAAKHPNVYCKVSALVEQTGKKPAPREVEYYTPVLDSLWKLFDEDRLLFGSNWPVSNGGATYETVVGIVRDYFTAKGEKAATKFFLGNSRTVYGWRPREITNTLGMKLVYVPPGTFLMGSPENEVGREKEETQHEVELTKGFYLGAHEVTVGQFTEFVKVTRHQTDAEKDGKGSWGPDAVGKFVMDAKFTWKNPGFEQTDDHPVVNVSWNDAKAFCKWLSEKEKKTYRLPTEAEWEFACRAGTTTAFAHGDDPEGLSAAGNVADATARANFSAWTLGIKVKDGHAFTAPVGTFKNNAFGLHDMHGNVWEWCADWYDPNGFTKDVQRDPTGPATGTARVQRGGGWSSAPHRARSASRIGRDPSAYRGGYLGFRIALQPADR